MSNKLSSMTWQEVEKEMSIAGSPAKIGRLGREIETLLLPNLDASNRAELTNAEFMLSRLTAEVKLLQRKYDKSH